MHNILSLGLPYRPRYNKPHTYYSDTPIDFTISYKNVSKVQNVFGDNTCGNIFNQWSSL